MRRRTFIAGLGSAAAWPVVARAQQGDRVRRIGVLMTYDENDPEGRGYVSVFTQALAHLSWTDTRNVRMVRWAGGDINRIRALAQELVGLRPDIILASSAVATAALQWETRTIPIVFAGVTDPVARGIVARLDRPSGNITGFAVSEATLAVEPFVWTQATGVIGLGFSGSASGVSANGSVVAGTSGNQAF